jgi:hypothetical protein
MRYERKRLGRRMRAWVVALAIAALTVAAAAPSAVALPGKFWGVVPQQPPTPEQLQRLKAGGVDSMRIALSWASVQPNQGGPIDFTSVDPLIATTATAGIEVLPFLYNAPSWAVPVDRRFASPSTLPVRNGKQSSGWKKFVQAAVLRYGPNGSFWAQNPAIPKRPIRTWQIWNEENFKYFVAKPNPVEYGKLVKLSAAAIKGVDPGAKIILGGMFARPIEATFNKKPPQAYFATDFLQQMYESTPGIKSKFQGVALHPYTGTYKRLIPYIEEFREVLKANNDAGKSLWITELGWSSQHPVSGNSFAKGRGGQAQQLRGAFRVLSAKQRLWHLQRVYWFSIGDQKGACNFCDGSGLFGEGFVPKPAWSAFVGFAGGTAG